MSDQIRSALSPKFGDEWDRIFGAESFVGQRVVLPAREVGETTITRPEFTNLLFDEGAIVQCETCYESFANCVHTSPHQEHGAPCERHGCKPTVPSDVARPALDNPLPKA